MLNLLIGSEDRPNRLESQNKDAAYHAKYAKYCISNAFNFLHYAFIEKVQLNKDFYKGNQWVLPEDTEAFFKDDTGQNRNRIKAVKNTIRPMIEQYRGNANRMQFNARAKSNSPMAINRREKQLGEVMFMHDLATELPEFKDAIGSQVNLGDTKEETEEIFQNHYVDDYVERMNYLLTHVADVNKFEQRKVKVAENLGLSGLAVMKGYEHLFQHKFEVVESERFFFDRSATEYDLSDSEYMGETQFMSPSTIFERYQELDAKYRIAIEESSKNMRKPSDSSTDKNGMMSQSGKIAVFHVYWRDMESIEYGYVLDPYGYPYLAKINYIEDGEEKPQYTTENLIDPPNQRAKRLLRNKKSRKLIVDVLRYAIIIPKELIAIKESDIDTLSDIVLEHGILPYQETELTDPSNVKFPYKCYTWGYIDGEIMSPVDDAINPQRLINRMLSVAENQINNSRGSGMIYDKSFFEQKGEEDEMLRNMNQSKPVGVYGKGHGIQNMTGTYDATVKNGTLVMFDIIKTMGAFTQEITGVNEALKGESMGNDQLVGVTQLMIQRGSLMQEPFYNAMADVFLQCYQSIATVGKRIYADNERELAIMVGDQGVKTFKISADMKHETFRVFIKRDNTNDMLKSAANNMLLTFFQLQLISKEEMANLYDRSTPEDISKAMRKKVVQDIEAARMAKKQQDAAAEYQTNMVNKQAEVQAADSEMNMAAERLRDKEKNDNDIAKIIAKGEMGMQADKQKAIMQAGLGGQ